MRRTQSRHDSLRPCKAGPVFFLAAAFVVAACGGPGSQPTVVEASGIEIRVSGEPADFRVGENQIWIELRDAADQPIESADVKVKVKGTYPATLIDETPGPTFGEPAIEDFEDPINLSFKNPNDTRANVGVRLHLVFLAIHGSYTFAKYPGVNVGLGINIR